MLALVADDDAILLRLVSRICAQAGLRVTACASGRELVDAARRLRPDLIISDVNMPGSPGGLQACAAIRGERPGTGIILMTGNPMVVPAIRDAGFTLILRKPFGIGEALRMIAAATKRPFAIMDGENTSPP
jgi:CheY-like chemotaxis protein